MLPKKRLYEEAFDRKELQSVQVGDFCVEHTVYKILNRSDKTNSFGIKTSQKSKFQYDECVIKETATSATLYTSEKKSTKTELIELFSRLSINDIWFATYLTHDKNQNWPEEIVSKIQSMKKEEAVKYIKKKDFTTFGKATRELAGQKILLQSDNNYYMVRDLNIYFEELKTNTPEIAAKQSIRTLDVNTLQSLIFNNIKYLLK